MDGYGYFLELHIFSQSAIIINKVVIIEFTLMESKMHWLESICTKLTTG